MMRDLSWFEIVVRCLTTCSPGKKFVAKRYIGLTERENYFIDTKMQMIAKKWAEMYNSLNPPKKVRGQTFTFSHLFRWIFFLRMLLSWLINQENCCIQWRNLFQELLKSITTTVGLLELRKEILHKCELP